MNLKSTRRYAYVVCKYCSILCNEFEHSLRWEEGILEPVIHTEWLLYLSFLFWLLCDIFSLSLLFMTLTVLRSTSHVVVECPSVEICLMFFSWLSWGRGRKTTEVNFHSHHISRDHNIPSLCFIAVEIVFQVPSLLSYSFISSFHTVLFGKKLLCTAHSLGWKMMFHRSEDSVAK